ncbi:MAG TPA: ornithine decarboxylase, partial [Kineosporiaceae bacterium]|nr:ornithine decarboxylase [Kineosporiaceae bacterium]
LGREAFLSDVLTTGGLDDRTSGHGYLQHAQELMADAVHADTAFFSTCGSSLSVKTAMISVAGPDEKLLIARNIHKSVISGLLLAGIEPVWVEPVWDLDLEITHPPTVEAVERALDEHPDAKGLLTLGPTDYGVASDLTAVTQACHRRGKPVIVDEAWGAHLPFHEGLPVWGMDADADVCVTSVHKAGSAFEQSSVFHLKGDRVDPAVLKQREDLLATTSTSSLLYAALDGWRRQMVEHGHGLIDGALQYARAVREGINEIDGLHAWTVDEMLARPGVSELDPYHVLIEVADLGISGYHALDWLRAEHGIGLGLSDHRRVEALITHGDDDATVQRLLDALADLAMRSEEVERAPRVEIPSPEHLAPQTVMLPRDAFFGRTESVPADEAPGRIAAELATPYPPGVPVLVPGDLITKEAVEYLRSGVAAGMQLPDPADPSLDTIKVVARD